MKTPTLSDRAYSLLKRRILDGELAPGAVISEPSLSAELKLSKAPVRTALLRLQHDGLIHSIRRHGYVVSKLSMRDALELLELRSLLEARVAFHAAGRVDPAFLDGVEADFARGYDRSDPESVKSYLRINRVYKVGLARATDNSRITKLVEDVTEILDRYIRLSVLTFDWQKTSLERVKRLNRALVSGDKFRAEEIAREHLHASAAAVLAALMFCGEDLADIKDISKGSFADMTLHAMANLEMRRW